ncbi:pentapeptide repeat-containing protein [Olsenella profusa]|uniref:Pentapeptide repeat-containing protein n=1 Tax=Olsenella profusa TaxID=138595 RepID=A0ABS2F2F2_9ACTN|nr:pentapeptide repeat-containing protein [Olsenella profusa]MBM6775176.1 pentapeptide repeat-containing protein [Olsenella profusa]
MPRAGGPASSGSSRLEGFARVTPNLGQHLGLEGLLDALGTPDARVENTAFAGLELTDASADGTGFENVAFRGCTFDHVDLSGCTFTDVVFSGCRFVGCDMGRSWLNRCDFRGCSAPGLTFLKGRLTGVSVTDSQMGYCDLSEATVDRLVARKSSLAEANVFGTRLRHVTLERCDLTRATFFRASLAGIDLSTCEIAGIRVSSDFHELRGATVSAEQAVQLVGLLGVRVTEDTLW